MLSVNRQAPAPRLVIQDLYGIGIRTPWPLHGASVRTGGRWDVEFLERDGDGFEPGRRAVPPEQEGEWAQGAALADGSRYRRWQGLFEFLVEADGRRIHARKLDEARDEAFLAYLLVHALSFSMVRLAREPLHATAVITDRGAVAFLAPSGGGKSTLGALFVRAGCPLLTDDMLVLTFDGDRCLAHAGPPQIKLYRGVAERIFGSAAGGVPLNPVTEKLVLPLGQAAPGPVPLRAIYVLDEPDGSGRLDARPSIHRLSATRAWPELLAATAGHWADEPARLRAQFEFVTRLARCVPVKRLTYDRSPAALGRALEAVLGDPGEDAP
jgi:hypothetical protein